MLLWRGRHTVKIVVPSHDFYCASACLSVTNKIKRHATHGPLSSTHFAHRTPRLLVSSLTASIVDLPGGKVRLYPTRAHARKEIHESRGE